MANVWFRNAAAMARVPAAACRHSDIPAVIGIAPEGVGSGLDMVSGRWHDQRERLRCPDRAEWRARGSRR